MAGNQKRTGKSWNDSPSPRPSVFRRKSLSLQVAEHILALIEDGDRMQPFPSATAMAADWHISRNTINEALAILKNRGIVSLRSGVRPSLLGPDRHHRRPASNRESPRIVLFAPNQGSLQNETVPMLASKVHLEDWSWNIVAGSRACREFLQERKAHREESLVLLGCGENWQRLVEKSDHQAVVLGSPAPGLSLSSVDRDYRALALHAASWLARRGHTECLAIMPQSPLAGDKTTVETLRKHFSGRIHCMVSPLHSRSGWRSPPKGEAGKTKAWFCFRPQDALGILTSPNLRLMNEVEVLVRDLPPWMTHVSSPLFGYVHAQEKLTDALMRVLRKMTRGLPRPATIRILPEFLSLPKSPP